MIEAALIGTGAATAILAIALLLALRANNAVTPTLVEYGRATIVSQRAQMLAEQERDEYKARAVKAEAERDAANLQLTTTQAELTKVLEDHATETVEEIRSAPSIVHALDVLNELLQKVPRLPSADTTSPGTSAHHSNTGATPVLSTKLA